MALSTFFRASTVVAVLVAVVHGTPDEDQLPDIDAVLNEATGTQAEFLAKMNAVQEKAMDQQKESMAALAKKKAYFERKLAEQAQQSNAIMSHISEIQQSQQNLQRGNEALLAETKKIRMSNRLLRSSLVALQPKMRIANNFLGQVLQLMDTDNVTALKVLEPPQPEPTLEHFLGVIKTQEQKVDTTIASSSTQEPVADVATADGKLSLLEVARATKKNKGPNQKAAAPEDFVPVLSQGLDNLAMAQSEGVARLKAQYMAQWELGQKNQDELAATQARLEKKVVMLQERQAELHTARATVMNLHDELSRRIEGVRLFVTKTQSMVYGALASAKKVAGNAAPSLSKESKKADGEQ